MLINRSPTLAKLNTAKFFTGNEQHAVKKVWQLWEIELNNEGNIENWELRAQEVVSNIERRKINCSIWEWIADFKIVELNLRTQKIDGLG